MGRNKKRALRKRHCDNDIAPGTEFPVTRPIQDATGRAPTLYCTVLHCSRWENGCQCPMGAFANFSPLPVPFALKFYTRFSVIPLRFIPAFVEDQTTAASGAERSDG